MLRGPRGEKRPADVIGNAVKVMRIATGEETNDLSGDGKDPAAKALGARRGAARARNMTPERPAEIVRACGLTVSVLLRGPCLLPASEYIPIS